MQRLNGTAAGEQSFQFAQELIKCDQNSSPLSPSGTNVLMRTLQGFYFCKSLFTHDIKRSHEFWNEKTLPPPPPPSRTLRLPPAAQHLRFEIICCVLLLRSWSPSCAAPQLRQRGLWVAFLFLLLVVFNSFWELMEALLDLCERPCVLLPSWHRGLIYARRTSARPAAMNKCDFLLRSVLRLGEQPPPACGAGDQKDDPDWHPDHL